DSVRNGRILDWMWGMKERAESSVTPRQRTWFDGEMVIPSTVIEKSGGGAALEGGISRSSVFDIYDDGDSRLDSSEFLKFLEQNQTAINITTFKDEETNKILRGLCVEALIELSDENADWKLSLGEFVKCLNPNFNPPEKKCALEDETYEDGAETQVQCNRCVCACGNWVCTAMACEGNSAHSSRHFETVEKSKRDSAKDM
uniref:Follistatin like 1 n=1 Tax=Leptobrachium leishanense TaxID=445787 RepID=A0A8C5MP29_9ANUR